jgi:tripartite-type tricarboxylate transporter receptor subunit TctC
MFSKLLLRTGTLMLAACAAFPAAAQPADKFYAGRSMTMIVPTSPGGINDISGRLVARHIIKHIPGAPSMVVQNQPGAGGIAGANLLYSTYEKDGSVIAMMERAIPQFAILGDKNAKFDPLKFTWLGSLSSYGDDAYLMQINADHPVQSVEDLRKPGVKIVLGANRTGSTNLTFALIAKEVLGLNITVIRGYTGAAPVMLAQQRGEVDGQVIGYASVRSGQKELWESKKLKPLLQFGRTTRHPDMPNVPTGRELAKTDEDRALIAFAELPFEMALPVVGPPNIPADRAQVLRAAFMAMVRDKAFLDDATKIGLEISPIDGAAVLKLIEASSKTAKAVIDRYNSFVNEQN